jgi:hypothetical protein
MDEITSTESKYILSQIMKNATVLARQEPSVAYRAKGEQQEEEETEYIEMKWNLDTYKILSCVIDPEETYACVTEAHNTSNNQMSVSIVDSILVYTASEKVALDVVSFVEKHLQ